MKQLHTFFLLICAITAGAQSFNRQLLFDGNSSASGSFVLPLADGHVLTVGSLGDQQDATAADILAFKTDHNGQKLWAKKYTSPNYLVTGCQSATPRMEYAVGAVEVADGYVIAGCYDRFQATWPFCGPNNHVLTARFDYLVLKINLAGDVIWAKTFGYEQFSEIATGIAKTKDGGFIISGFTQAGTLSSGEALKPFFLKLDAAGNQQWSNTLYSFYQKNCAFFIAASRRMPIIELSDGSYVCAVSSGLETHMIKFSDIGQVVWAKTLAHGGTAGEIQQQWGGGAASAAYFHSIAELSTGNLAFLGNFGFAATVFPLPDPNGNNSLFVGLNTAWYLEATADGNYVRNSIFSHPNPGTNIPLDYSATDMELLPNGHLLVAGAHSWASVLLEYDPQATDNQKVVWAKRFDTYTYSSIPYSYDLPACARRDDQAYLLTDNFKLGLTSLSDEYDNCHPAETLQALTLSAQNFGDFSPDFSSLSENAEVTLIAQPLVIEREVACGVVASTEPLATRSLEAYPSPLAGQSLTVAVELHQPGEYTCTVRDQLGWVVTKQQLLLVAGQQTFELALPVPAGFYYLSLRGPEKMDAQKILKIN